MDLETDRHPVFEKWIEDIDTLIKNNLKKFGKTWVSKEYHDSILEEFYYSPIKKREGFSSAFRAKLSVDGGEITTPVFDIASNEEKRIQLAPDVLKKGAHAIALVKLADVFISANGKLISPRYYIQSVKVDPLPEGFTGGSSDNKDFKVDEGDEEIMEAIRARIAKRQKIEE